MPTGGIGEKVIRGLLHASAWAPRAARSAAQKARQWAAFVGQQMTRMARAVMRMARAAIAKCLRIEAWAMHIAAHFVVAAWAFRQLVAMLLLEIAFVCGAIFLRDVSIVVSFTCWLATIVWGLALTLGMVHPVQPSQTDNGDYSSTSAVINNVRTRLRWGFRILVPAAGLLLAVHRLSPGSFDRLQATLASAITRPPVDDSTDATLSQLTHPSSPIPSAAMPGVDNTVPLDSLSQIGERGGVTAAVTRIGTFPIVYLHDVALSDAVNAYIRTELLGRDVDDAELMGVLEGTGYLTEVSFNAETKSDSPWTLDVTYCFSGANVHCGSDRFSVNPVTGQTTKEVLVDPMDAYKDVDSEQAESESRFVGVWDSEPSAYFRHFYRIVEMKSGKFRLNGPEFSMSVPLELVQGKLVGTWTNDATQPPNPFSLEVVANDKLRYTIGGVSVLWARK